MKTLLKSRIISFAETAGFCPEKVTNEKLAELFEYYAVAHFLSKYVSDIREVESTIIPPDDGGIDGFAISVNGQLVDDASDFDEILQEGNSNNVRIGFLQAKTSEKYDTKDIARFLDAIRRVTKAAGSGEFDNVEKSLWPKTEILKEVIRKIHRFSTGRVPCDVFFVTLSTTSFFTSQDDLIKLTEDKSANVSQVFQAYKDLEADGVFDFRNFKAVGESALESRIAELRGTHEVDFRLDHPVEIAPTGAIAGALMGVIPVSELRKIILDDNGELRENIFEGNVRLYQGENNPVNQEIANTLRSDLRDFFPFLNNGLTIVTREMTRTMGNIHMRGYQIVNGCQTSNQIAQWIQSSDGDQNILDQSQEVLVPIKIIQTDDPDASRQITVATNSQTAISQADIQGNSSLARRIEEYFNRMPDNDSNSGRIKLRYKRQSGQDTESSIPDLRTYTTQDLSRAYTSCILGNSSEAIRSSKMSAEPGSPVWLENGYESLFYFSMLTVYKIERVLQRDAKGIRPAKYHIAMLAAAYAIPSLRKLWETELQTKGWSKQAKNLESILETDEWIEKLSEGIDLAMQVVQDHFSSTLKSKSLVKDDVRTKNVQQSLLSEFDKYVKDRKTD